MVDPDRSPLRRHPLIRLTIGLALLLALAGAAFQLDLDAGATGVDAATVAEALAARDGDAAPPVPNDDALWQRAQELVEVVVEQGCVPYLLGEQSNAFGESAAACDAFLSAALVSLSLDRPERVTAAVRGVDRLIEHALSPAGTRPFASTGWLTVAGQRLPRSVLYQGFLLLVLAGRERLVPDNARSALFDALANSLAQRLEASAAGFLPTYGDHMVWPCDHTPALSALTLHGVLRPAHPARTRDAALALTARLAARLDQPGGFATRIAPSGKTLEATPRGVAMAWSAGFALAGAPELAARFAVRFDRQFCHRQVGLAACREWPPGVERAADASSGPIVLGFGVGASALGLAASRALADDTLHRNLVRTAHLVGIDRLLAQPARYPLENAIYLWARSARPWLPALAPREKP